MKKSALFHILTFLMKKIAIVHDNSNLV